MNGFLKRAIDKGLLMSQSQIKLQFRSREDAHRFSTAYHIAIGEVSLEHLKIWPIDIDGNVWFRGEWLHLINLEANSELCLKALVKANAAANAPEIWIKTERWHSYKGRVVSLEWPDLAFALEGYPGDSIERRPNHPELALSKHVTGMAIDVDLFLGELTDVWDPAIDRTAAKYGIWRPYDMHTSTPEHWHFELMPDASGS